MRGNRDPARVRQPRRGSIPACAGKPRTRPRACDRAGVDPRVCGETELRATVQPSSTGRSPRVRGNPGHVRGRRCGHGSIPACAGKPAPSRRTRTLSRVDPRVCGETPRGTDVGGDHPGRSPRVRGNQAQRVGVDLAGGSIPACAGKPRRGHDHPEGSRVDPRVCGETKGRIADWILPKGRSPRVRGNHPLPAVPPAPTGSIPACAGKPPLPPWARAWIRVDPRVCGETTQQQSGQHSPRGRSPRVRGNPDKRLSSDMADRSIPACAGKPRPGRGAAAPRAVDPRVCGETDRMALAIEAHHGRSPRVRGNHHLGAVEIDREGSIPACAGKP